MKIELDGLIVHPKYNGYEDCGFDIALAPYIDLPDVRSKGRDFKPVKDVVCVPIEPDSIGEGLEIEVAGYPGKKGGYPYVHKGVIKGVKKTALGG